MSCYEIHERTVRRDGRCWPLPDGLLRPEVTPDGHRVVGLAGALAGCGCDGCTHAWEQTAAWVARRVAGDTLTQIGSEHGVTREAVRLRTEQLAPDKPWEAAAANRRAQANPPAAPDPCRVCADPVPTGRRRLCSRRCAHVWSLLAYHADPDRHDRDRRAAARWVVRNADRHDLNQMRHARRLLGGKVNADPQRRWLIPGSGAFRAAVAAYRNGWPVFDLLPEPVREQISAACSDAEQDAA